MDDIGPLLTQLVSVITNAGTLGVLGTIAAVVALLVQATKAPLVHTWLSTKKWGVWLPVALGAVLSLVTALVAGTGWVGCLVALVTGAVGGLAAAGSYTALTRGSSRQRAEAAIADQLATPPPSVAALMAAYQAAQEAPEGPARLKAKADFLDRYLPGPAK